MKYFKKLEGEKVYLSPINPEDYETTTKWFNDEKISKNFGENKYVVSLPEEKESLEKRSQQDYFLSIILKENNQLIGETKLNNYSFIDKTASIYAFIGEREYLNQEYELEALSLLMKYSFKTLGIINLETAIYEYNKQSIETFTKLGFKESGRRTKAKYSDGQYHDIIYMEYINND